MNKSREYCARMLSNLTASLNTFGKHLADATIQRYIDKLAKYDYAEETWARATSLMESELDSFPSPSTIRKYLQFANRKPGMQGDERSWVLSTRLVIYRGAIRCDDPQYPPVPPENDTDLHLSIAPHLQHDYRPVSLEVGRKCFAEGYRAAGGKEGELTRYLDSVTAKPTSPRKPQWYDDKDAA